MNHLGLYGASGWILLLAVTRFGGNCQTTSIPELTWNITISPSFLSRTREGQNVNITVEIGYLGADDGSLDGSRLFLHLENQSPRQMNLISNDTILLPSDILVSDTLMLIDVQGRQVGKSVIQLDIIDNSGIEQGLNYSTEYEVHVVMAESVLNEIFNVGVLVSSALNTFAFSCRLEIDQIKNVFAKPVGIVIGFCLQYCFLPGVCTLYTTLKRSRLQVV